MIRSVIPSRLWLMAAALMLSLTAVAPAQTARVSYDLEQVWLLPDVSHPSAAARQLTGRFEWTYTIGDFENGSGEFSAISVPWSSFGLPDLGTTFDLNSIEIVLEGSIHDHGVDVTLFLEPLLAPDQASPVDLVNSKFDIEQGGISHKGHVISGSIVPDLSANPWLDLGEALAGSNGLPLLSGLGSLAANDPVSLVLTNALADTSAGLVIGVDALNAPFKGGVLVPDPLLILAGLPTGPTGELSIDATWPDGIPSGFTSYYQIWIADPDGPKGFAASNALSATTP